MTITFYTRQGCPLCDEARTLLRGFDVRDVDIDADLELQQRFGERVPVIEVAGSIVAEGEIDAADLARALRAASVEH